jgi:hypothetical protein
MPKGILKINNIINSYIIILFRFIIAPKDAIIEDSKFISKIACIQNSKKIIYPEQMNLKTEYAV